MKCFFLFFLLLSSVSFNEEDVLKQAQEKILQVNYIEYISTSYWPDPAGNIDTTLCEAAFLKKDRQYFNYDYVGRKAAYDIVYTNNNFMMVHHQDKTVFTYSEEDMQKDNRKISDNNLINFSPLNLLNPEKHDWIYVRDTVQQNIALLQYYLVEMDTLINGNKIFVEQHIFIDKASALLTRFERRAYKQNKLSQKISIEYNAYELKQHGPSHLTYELPENYATQVYGEREKLKLIVEGEKAPSISLPDLDGKIIDIQHFKGKYILLDFSVVNCGYCKKALDHFNRKDYKLSGNIVGIYLNPEDSQKKIEQYKSKIPIPFTVVNNADRVTKAYGVAAYPTFVLINPEGIIEKVVQGYQEEFVDSLQSI